MRNSIRQEPYGDGLIRTYDELGYMIMQNETGILYVEAVDVQNKYTYSETENKIDSQNENIADIVEIDVTKPVVEEAEE